MRISDRTDARMSLGVMGFRPGTPNLRARGDFGGISSPVDRLSQGAYNRGHYA